MASVNQGSAPYNDRFYSGTKRDKVLFRPDRALQQSELNELQSIAQYNLRQLGDSMFEDGALQTGMEFSIDEDKGEITVDEGLVYLDGKIRQFHNQTVKFSGKGKENLGVKIRETIVDHEDDSNLLDQTQGVPSTLSAGADRLEEEVILTVNDEDASTIYEFDDGKLYIEPDRPEFSQLNTVLAQRTYEESGSYQVSGFNMWAEKNDDPDKVTLVIDEGVAYVRGYRVSKTTPTRLDIDKSQEYRNVTKETHSYDTSDRKIEVGSPSVKKVDLVLARTESPAGGIEISKGDIDSRDQIPAEYTSVVRDSTKLWTDIPEKVYEYDRDYKIVEENGIQYVDWNTGNNGKEPDKGTTYLLTFEYDREMEEGTDFTIKQEEYGNERGWDTYIDFNDMTGHKPKDGGIVSISYDFYLAREDVVYLNKKGDFKTITGEPDILDKVKSPDFEDPQSLRIGNISLYPNSDVAEAENNGVFRLTMGDLQKLKTRVRYLENNQANLMLERESIISEDPLDMRGVFADSFTDNDRMDLQLSSVALSLDDASVTLPITSPDDMKRRPGLDLNKSTANTWGRLVSAPFKEVREVTQPYATEAMNVNPYQVFNKMGVLELDPETDNWIDEENITIHEEDEVDTDINRWWRHQGEPRGKLSKKNQYLVNNTSLHGGIEWGGPGGRVSEDNPTGIGADIEGTMLESSEATREEAIEHMRQREVEFHAKNLLPQSDNLVFKFDSKKVHVEPIGGSIKGTEDGTLRSDSNGKVHGKFTVPANVKTGTKEVSLENEENLATSTYTAEGTRKITEETITKTRVTFHLYDPLAQSFAFSSDRVVTSLDLFFGSKPALDSGENVIVQIRGLSKGGYPNRTIYSETMLEPKDINVSNDASKATNVALPDPLQIDSEKNYCVALVTDSSEYTAWVGTLGEDLVDDPDETITSQPYTNGVLFSSSNAVTWTAHQKSNLKFNIYTAEFEDTAIMEFDTMDNLDSDMILLMASFLTPDNTGCFWEVKLIYKKNENSVTMNDVKWTPIENYEEQEMEDVVSRAKLRATFRANKYTSPILALDDLTFSNFIASTEGDYVSKTISTEESPFNTVRLSFDAFEPSGTEITPYYSLDGGTTWKEFTDSPEQDRQSADYYRYNYVEEVSKNANNSSLKFKLNLVSDTRFRRPRARRLVSIFRDEIRN